MTKITLIGAGSTSFSIELLRDISLTPSLAGCTLTLVDIDVKRLEVAKKLVERYSEEAKTSLNIEASTERRIGLKGADYVICAVKVGGYEPLEEERRIAEKHGYYRGIGDRVSCYYGGIGAYHQLCFIEDLTMDMEDICPDAILIETANPVFELTNYVIRNTKIKTVGVCHGHFEYKSIAKVLGLDLEKVSAQVVGFNHCNWLSNFMYNGKDAYPLLDEWIEKKADEYWSSDEYKNIEGKDLAFSDGQMSPGAIDAYKLYGIMPIGDAVRSVSPWWHHTDLQTKEKWYGTGGGFDSERGWKSYLDRKVVLQRKVDGLLNSKDPIMKEFPPISSGEQHIPFIDAVENDIEKRLVLNVPNKGSIEGIPDDVVVEIPVVVSGKGYQQIHVGQLPGILMNNIMLPRMAQMENILDAYIHNDRTPLILMLMADHRTGSYKQAVNLIDTLLDLQWNAEAKKHYK